MIIFLSSFFCLCVKAQVDSASQKNAEKIITKPQDVKVNPLDETLQNKNRLIPAAKDSGKKKTQPDLNDSSQNVLAKIDSLKIDSLRLDSVKQDSLKKIAQLKADTTHLHDTSTYRSILAIPYLPFNKPPVFMITKARNPQTKDELFYLLTGLIFFTAFIKLIFPKYFQNLLLLSFQTSFRQRQTREQLTQDNLASLLMNILFFMSGGIFISLVAHAAGYSEISFWKLLLPSSLVLAVIYSVKYIFLIFFGWIFNVRSAVNAYVFIVFMINKIIGIVLIPFLLVLAFSSIQIAQPAMILALILIGILLIYRYLISLITIRHELKVNAIHFFLYLCAVEVLPLLLIYKILFNYIGSFINTD